jgi:hypothetical protein
VREFNPQDAANTIWAFAVLRLPVTAVPETLKAVVKKLLPQMPAVQVSQVLQSDIFYNLLSKSDREEYLKKLPPCGLDHSSVGRDHKEVVEVLELLGYKPLVEHSLPELKGIYQPDVFLPEFKLVIEYDGPTHFTNGGRTPTLRTGLRNRSYERCGYKVLPIPCKEWTSRNREEKVRYLEEKVFPLPMYRVFLFPSSPVHVPIAFRSRPRVHASVRMGQNFDKGNDWRIVLDVYAN